MVNPTIPRAPEGAVLLTGATGFVGAYVGAELARRGIRVVALARPATAPRTFRFAAPDLVLADLSDREALTRVLADRELRAVIHVAGLTKARRNAEFDEVNVAGARNLAAAVAASPRKPQRFLHISSLAAAGPSGDRPRVETDPCVSVSAYGRSKLAGEQAIREALEGSAIPWTIVRPPIVYGEWDRDLLLVFRQIRGGLLPIVGGRATLSKRYSLVHAEDLARGIVEACFSPRAENQLYFLPGPRDASFEEMATAIEAAVGRRARRIPIPPALAVPIVGMAEAWTSILGKPSILNRDKLRELAAPGWACSGAAAARDFGYAPRIDFPEGLRREAEWARGAGLL